MGGTDRHIESTQIIRITKIGLISNLGLAGIKLIIGYLTFSIALIADGYHSLSDLSTDVVLLVGSRLSERPPDQNHPYGHGRFETFAAWGIAVILIMIGAWLAYKGITALYEPARQLKNGWIIFTSFVSLAVKEWLYQVTMRVARKCRSSSLKANAWHHRSDALSSAVVMVSAFLGVFGWQHGDAIGGFLVGIMVFIVGGKLAFDAMMEMSEASPGLDFEKKVEMIISQCPEVRGWHRLRMRRIGRELFMDIHILLDPELTVGVGHEIAENVERKISYGLDWPINIMIHIDPDTSEIREASGKLPRSVNR